MAQEVPKRAPRGPKRLPKCPQEGSTMAPIGLRDAPRANDRKGIAIDSCRRRRRRRRRRRHRRRLGALLLRRRSLCPPAFRAQTGNSR